MRRLGPPLLGVSGVVGLLGVLATGATACGSAPLDAALTHRSPLSPTIIARTASPPLPAPAPAPAPGVDLSAAASVAQAEVVATWTTNTAVDLSWYPGELRASAYMTPAYATSIRDHPPTGGPGATWMAWAAHQATTSVTTTVEADPGGPIDTSTVAYEKVIATVTPLGPSGWVGTPETWVTYVVLSRKAPGSPWQVSTTETAP